MLLLLCVFFCLLFQTLRNSSEGQLLNIHSCIFYEALLNCVCVCVCEQELELVEDVWRGEAQDLLSQISQLQEENKTLLNNLSVKEYPMTEEDIQKQEGSVKAQCS